MKKLILVVIIVALLTATFGCSLTTLVDKANSQSNTNSARTAVQSSQSNTLETYTSKDGGCNVKYDSDLWKTDEQKDIIYFKGKNSYIQIKDYTEKISEQQYVDLLLQVYEEHAIAGTVTSTRQMFGESEYPLIYFEQDQGKYILSRDILVVMNGDSQYEIIFVSNKDDYEYVKEYAYKVFETVSLTNPSNVVYDDEMAESLDLLNKAEGIDKKSAIENISTDGKELIGSWGTKDKDGNIIIRFTLTSDNKYSWYKSFPDEDNILTGEWSYPEQRLLKLSLKKAIVDGSDVTSTLDPDLSYEILSFKDDTMKMICLNNQRDATYYKVVDK